MKNKSSKRAIPAFVIVIMVVGLLAIISIPVLLQLTKLSQTIAVLIPLLVYIITILLVIFIRLLKVNRQKKVSEEIKSNFEQVTKGFLTTLSNPCVICDQKGRIVWYNDSFLSKSKSKTHLYSKFIDSVTDSTIEKILQDESPNGSTVTFASPESSKVNYNTRSYQIKINNESYTMIMFIDRSEVDDLVKKLNDEDVVVSYLAIDNVEDVAKITNSSIDLIMMNIKKALREYTDKYDGIMRDNGKNRYLFIFSRKFLDAMKEEKFVILDTVRGLSEGLTSPITISIGLADISGSLEEKSEIASQALELALQRGGDQAVVKEKSKVSYYGGKTKGISSGSGVRGRVLANEFKSLVLASKNVLVMGHKYPDFDAIGSSIGISRICKYLGVKVNIICNRNDKNLEDVFAMLDSKEYESLFISASEAQELISSETLAVVCDVNNIPISEAPDVVNMAKHVVIIDHHRKTQEFTFEPDIQYIEPNVSSASELVAEFLQNLIPQKELPKVEAELLYAGISLDTKKLTHNTGVKTFVALQYLRETGADPEKVEKLFAITLSELSSEAEYESSIVKYKTVIAIAYYDNKGNASLARISAARAADKMLTVKGILASFAICKIGDSYHISARSTGEINVQLILEEMGGGGHYDSAGALVDSDDKANVFSDLKKAIDKYYINETKG